MHVSSPHQYVWIIRIECFYQAFPKMSLRTHQFAILNQKMTKCASNNERKTDRTPRVRSVHILRSLRSSATLPLVLNQKMQTILGAENNPKIDCTTVRNVYNPCTQSCAACATLLLNRGTYERKTDPSSATPPLRTSRKLTDGHVYDPRGLRSLRSSTLPRLHRSGTTVRYATVAVADIYATTRKNSKNATI